MHTVVAKIRIYAHPTFVRTLSKTCVHYFVQRGIGPLLQWALTHFDLSENLTRSHIRKASTLAGVKMKAGRSQPEWRWGLRTPPRQKCRSGQPAASRGLQRGRRSDLQLCCGSTTVIRKLIWLTSGIEHFQKTQHPSAAWGHSRCHSWNRSCCICKYPKTCPLQKKACQRTGWQLFPSLYLGRTQSPDWLYSVVTNFGSVNSTVGKIRQQNPKSEN